MKQPIETLLTELAVLEGDLSLAKYRLDQAIEKLYDARVNLNLKESQVYYLKSKIETIKTQIAQANENS